MSTRCNIKVVVDGDTVVWLYHHCDGYVEGVGRNLADFLRRVNEDRTVCPLYPEYLITNLIKEGVTWPDGTPDNSYEWTGGQQGDIEYLYTIEYKDNKEVTLSVEGIYNNDDDGVLYHWEAKERTI